MDFWWYMPDRRAWQFSLWKAWMPTVLFPVGLTQRGWGRPCSHACSVETGWVGPSSPLWEEGYVDFLPWFLCVWKLMCRYARVKVLLHTWVTLASVVGGFFCSFKGAVFCPPPGEVIGVWRVPRAWGIGNCLSTARSSPFLKQFHLFVSWWPKVFSHVSCCKPCSLGMTSSSGWLMDCLCVFKGAYPLLCVCFWVSICSWWQLGWI